MKSRLGGIQRMFLNDKLAGANVGSTGLTKEKEQRAIEWCTVFRRNWDIFAEFFLGIPLKPYQRAALHEIGVSDVFFWRAARNGAKSFVTSIAAICKLLLYPNCWIVVTASTVDQANKIVKDKIEKEIIKKLSPFLLYCLEQGWIQITKPTDGYLVECTLNNSTLTVLAPVESARGSRSNFTIYDEVAVMKKDSIDQIFEGMLFPRQPTYLNNPKYSKNPRWVEESKAIYLTSSKYKYQWWYSEWKNCVSGYYTEKKLKYNIFATDYFDNIENGLKTWNDFKRAKRGLSDFTFRMEMLNEAIGEVEDSFFTLKSFKANQILTNCFRPPTNLQVVTGTLPKNRPKETTEIRLICADFAFANTTSKTKNDNTILVLLSLLWKKNKFERRVEYIERVEASDSLGAVDRIKELYFDYEADYIVMDIRGGGEALYNYLTMPKEHPVRGSIWNPHGFTISERTKYQMAQENKLKDLEERTVDPEPIRCIIPFVATPEINSRMWIELRKQLESNNIKFLVDMKVREEELIDSGEYYNLSVEELVEDKLPFGETELLIQEAINLQVEIKLDKVKLTELRQNTKDRIVALAYGNYIANLIENDWQKNQERSVDVDVESMQLVW